MTPEQALGEWTGETADYLAEYFKAVLNATPEHWSPTDRYKALISAVTFGLGKAGLHEHIYGVIIKGSSVIDPVAERPVSSNEAQIVVEGPDTGGYDIGLVPPSPRRPGPGLDL